MKNENMAILKLQTKMCLNAKGGHISHIKKIFLSVFLKRLFFSFSAFQV